MMTKALVGFLVLVGSVILSVVLLAIAVSWGAIKMGFGKPSRFDRKG